MTARRDGAGNHALALLIARHSGTQLLNDADGLMPDRESPADRILALEDMDVGAANSCCRYTDQRVEGADIGHWLGVENDSTRFDEDGGFHLGHGSNLEKTSKHESMRKWNTMGSGAAHP